MRNYGSTEKTLLKGENTETSFNKQETDNWHTICL